MNPITEDDIADFLLNTPDFFERHAELLAAVQLTSPHGGRAVSLQERQAEMLRAKIRGLELGMAEMIRHAQDNVNIASKLQQWTQALLLVREAADVPGTIITQLQTHFDVPQVALRLWQVAPAWATQPWAQSVSDEAKAFVADLQAPYCGSAPTADVSAWLAEPATAASVAVIALRVPMAAPAAPAVAVEAEAGAEDAPTPPLAPAFGALVLASDQAERYQADMGTAFLERIGALTSAALSRVTA